jgi:hypothetical protein
MPSHLVHFAAPALRAANIVRQRCACGALIDEMNLDRTAVAIGEGETADDARRALVNDDGTPARGWQGLVAVDVHEGVVTAKWSSTGPAG